MPTKKDFAKTDTAKSETSTDKIHRDASSEPDEES